MEDTNEFVLFYLCYSAYYIYKYNYYLITVLTTISIRDNQMYNHDDCNSNLSESNFAHF